VTEIPKPNVVAESLIFLLHIKEVPGSNLGSETDSPTYVLMVFLRPSRQMPE
jgi:hypothetical protein